MPPRLIRFVLAVLAIFLAAPALAQNPYVVADVTTGAVLAHNKAFKRWYPASVTKIMTARLAFKAVQAGDLSMKSPVRMTSRAVKEPPSKMGYPVGTVLTLENAIKIILRNQKVRAILIMLPILIAMHRNVHRESPHCANVGWVPILA